MSKRHDIYVLVDRDGRYVDAFLPYSEANRELSRRARSGVRIVTVHGREWY